MADGGKLDYEKLGLLVGLEIHQELDTHKLFCSCPSALRDDAPDLIVKRKLRTSAGETGEIDIAALHEHKLAKDFIYETYSGSTCLVEIDEEPPHGMNTEALDVVLQFSKMVDAKINDEIEVMRKTVVDGSNTSGFQRTSLVARKGFIEVNKKRIGIPTICIEEDAARIIKKEHGISTFRLDRLGIPLIEIATDPDIRSPEETKEVAAHIGMLLRSIGKVKRGLGTIRQDLNVNIKGFPRVEIKGAQDLKLIPQIVEYEILREKNLLDLVRRFPKKTFSPAIVDLTHELKNTKSKVLVGALKQGGDILGIRMEGYAGLTGFELCPNKRLGTELSDFAKQRAGVKGLFHADELPNYGITEEEVEIIKKKLGCKKEDGFIIIADAENTARTALNSVIERLNMLKNEQFQEVRKANDDGTTTFMRPMPGAARMYPETDVKPIKITKDYLDKIEIPKLLSEKKEEMIEKYELGADLAAYITKQGINLDELMQGIRNIKPAFIAETIISIPKAVKARYGTEIKPTNDDWRMIFKALDENRISRDSIIDILNDSARQNKAVSGIIRKFELMSDSDLEKELKNIVAQNKGLPFNALIGKAMAQLRGKADGKKIVEMLKKAAS